MDIIDNVGMTGEGTVEVHCAETGELLGREKFKNLILENTATQIISAFTGTPADLQIGQIAVGTDGTAPVQNDTALGNEVLSQAPTSSAIYSPLSVGWKLFLPAGTLNGTTLREVGLKSIYNQLLTRAVFTPVTKTSAVTITISYTITFY